MMHGQKNIKLHRMLHFTLPDWKQVSRTKNKQLVSSIPPKTFVSKFVKYLLFLVFSVHRFQRPIKNRSRYVGWHRPVVYVS